MSGVQPPIPWPEGWDAPPKLCIEQIGRRRWRAWLSVGLMTYERQWGTYAWTEARAWRKAERLHRHWLKSHARNRQERAA